MPFCVPMIWRQQEDHATDCYFCLTKFSGFSGRSRNKIKYANIKSVSKTVPRISDMETPTPPSAPNVGEDYVSTTMEPFTP